MVWVLIDHKFGKIHALVYFCLFLSFAVLSHVKSFLPKLGAANSELMEKMREKGKESVEIEHVDESNPHIAMVRTCYYTRGKVLGIIYNVHWHTSAETIGEYKLNELQWFYKSL